MTPFGVLIRMSSRTGEIVRRFGWRNDMASRTENGLDREAFQSPWPSLVWIVFAAVIAVTALMLAPVPN